MIKNDQFFAQSKEWQTGPESHSKLNISPFKNATRNVKQNFDLDW